MPIGPFGEIIGTTGTLETLGDGAAKYKSKVIAPRNPKLVRGQHAEFKVNNLLFEKYKLKIASKNQTLISLSLSIQVACRYSK